MQGARGVVVKVGTNDVPRSGYRADRNNWAPRVGLAWAPGTRRTVLRAGYGIYYDQSAQAIAAWTERSEEIALIGTGRRPATARAIPLRDVRAEFAIFLIQNQCVYAAGSGGARTEARCDSGAASRRTGPARGDELERRAAPRGCRAPPGRSTGGTRRGP